MRMLPFHRRGRSGAVLAGWLWPWGLALLGLWLLFLAVRRLWRWRSHV